ncbi:UNVERIFIED_CONTAM: hypothetical protein GTU68_039022 [Idotea baltica]|nr:hypothetical protein [Idotea baltica]
MTKYIVAFLLILTSVTSYAKTPKQQRQGAVATAHPAATVAGEETLRLGGNAFDAAVAIAGALAVVEPYNSGLGGGGFFLLRKPGKNHPSYHFIDARERAPLAANQDMYKREGKVQPYLSLNGPLAAGIPGVPAALVYLAKKYGHLSLRESLTPAIRLARDGVSFNDVYLNRAQFRLNTLRNNPETARIFLAENDIPPLFGLLRQPELAHTLEKIADQGKAGFYTGDTAQKLVSSVRAAGGIWTLNDLRNYKVIERKPIRTSITGGRELISAPPPSAGGIALAQSLGILEQLPWKTSNKVQRIHYTVEALRRAYHDRGLLGDPDFVKIPTRKLLNVNYLKKMAANIDDNRATPSYLLPKAPAWKEGMHTTHFTVIDKKGNAVSATLSLNLPFGSGFTAKGTGVLLNDQMDDFAADINGSNVYGLTGSQANSIAGGKRPLSSMSPTFIESKNEVASFGTPGGSRIPSMVLLAILQYMDNQPINTWTSTPRYHHQYLPDVIEYEPKAFSSTQKAELKRRGYILRPLNRHYGNLQVLRWNKRTGKAEAASDPRELGTAVVTPRH